MALWCILLGGLQEIKLLSHHNSPVTAWKSTKHIISKVRKMKPLLQCCLEGPFRSSRCLAKHPSLPAANTLFCFTVKRVPGTRMSGLMRSHLYVCWMSLTKLIDMYLWSETWLYNHKLSENSLNFHPFCHIREHTQPLLSKVPAKAEEKEISGRVLLCNPKMSL